MTFDTQMHSTITVTCAPGLAGYLEKELRALGYDVKTTFETGVTLEGSLQDTETLNLTLRTAYNVLFLIHDFRCTSPNELYRKLVEIEWDRFIALNEYISVVSRVDNPRIKNSMFANMKVKDAIVDQIARRHGRRPDSGPNRDHVVVSLYWKGSRAQVHFNTSGRKLSDRNYRKMPHLAPLRETLAAAIVMETGYDGSTPLLNPMCGSGTLAIEAALIATGRAPGLLRSNYGFKHLKTFDESSFNGQRARLRKQGRKGPIPPIVATDIDDGAIAAARQNARTAGVEQLISFDVCDFSQTKIPKEPGIIVMNPEYGVRVGQISQLEKTYRRIGDFLKQSCGGYRAYLFSGNARLVKKVGLHTSRRIPFFNADIECRLLEYELYAGTKKEKSPRER